MKKIVALFLLILLSATLLVWLLITRKNTQLQELGKELGKLTGQVTLVAVIGGIFVQEYSRRRERSIAVNEFKKSVLKSFVNSYAGVKKNRRLLRARCRIRTEQQGDEKRIEISRLAYDEQMGSLSETQLELELLIHELNTFPDAFSSRATIRKSIQKMEEYLGTLITEYELSLRKSNDGDFIPLDQLARLSDFIHGRKESFFRKNFTQSFHSALSLIQQERLRIS